MKICKKIIITSYIIDNLKIFNCMNNNGYYHNNIGPAILSFDVHTFLLRACNFFSEDKYTDLPLILLKDNHNDLPLISAIFYDEDNNWRSAEIRNSLIIDITKNEILSDNIYSITEAHCFIKKILIGLEKTNNFISYLKDKKHDNMTLPAELIEKIIVALNNKAFRLSNPN